MATTISRRPVSHFFALYRYGVVKGRKPDAIRATDTPHEWDDDEKYRFVRRLFEPLGAAERFRVVCSDWHIRDRKDARRFIQLSQEEQVRECQTEAEEFARRGDPASLIELPPGLDCNCELTDDDPLLTREAGLAEVAEINARSIAEWPNTLGFGKQPDWAMLIELGEPIGSGCISPDIEANGIGCETRTLDWPIRVVRPTDEELARYAIEWEGGAA
jgi:hypothetical protein